MRWMTCALLLLLLAPQALASGDPERTAEEARDGAQEAVEDAATYAEETASDAVSEARIAAHNGWDDTRHTAKDSGNEAGREAEAHREIALALLAKTLNDAPGTLLSTVDEATSEVIGMGEEAQRRVPTLTRDWGEPEPASAEGSDISPQAEAVTPLEFREPLLIMSATAAAAGLLFWLAGATGMAKAGAGSAAGTVGTDLKKLLPYASPLFTRFERDTVLGHPKREALYAQIMTKPGVTLQDLCDETGLSRTAVSHHLRLLEQQHLIVSKRMGRSRHFFENGGRYGRDQKDAYAVLHNDRSKDVRDFITQHPGAIQKDLCEALGIQASVAHWHVKRLTEANLIDAVRQGRTVSYFPIQGGLA